MTENEVNITFTVAEFPEELYTRFGVTEENSKEEGLTKQQHLLHEILCNAIHEDSDDAHDALCSYVTDIEPMKVVGV